MNGSIFIRYCCNVLIWDHRDTRTHKCTCVSHCNIFWICIHPNAILGEIWRLNHPQVYTSTWCPTMCPFEAILMQFERIKLAVRKFSLIRRPLFLPQEAPCVACSTSIDFTLTSSHFLLCSQSAVIITVKKWEEIRSNSLLHTLHYVWLWCSRTPPLHVTAVTPWSSTESLPC